MQRHKTILALFALAGLGGCAVPQNTVLFATNTTIALDLSISPTNGTPNVTIGYKRQEGVIMPLMASKRVYPPNATSVPDQPSLTTGEAETDTKGLSHKTDHGSGDALLCASEKLGSDTHDPCVFRGTGSDGTDTYSVLASIGTDVGGNVSAGSSGSASGQVQVAQFFATGLAARELARSGGAALVNTNATAPGSASPAALQMASNIETQQTANLAKISNALRGDSNFPTDRDAAISKASPALDAPTATYLKSFTTKDQFMAALQSDYSSTTSIAAGIS
jgi:hypothetical protein